MNNNTITAINAAAMLALLAVGCAAHAEGNPYSIGAGVSFGRDSNLFRAPEGQEVADSVITTSVFGGVDQTIGRQRLQANATLRHSDYRERDDLDHNGYRVQLGWNGATANEISWNLSYGANRGLASYATLISPELRVPNIETSQQAIAGMQVGLQAQWVANATLSHRDIDYSAAGFAAEKLKLDAVGLGVQWNPAGPVSISVGPRFTRGRYPQARALAGGGFEADAFDRRDLDLGVNWVVTGASTLGARLSLTRQRYDLLSERDFSGATGRLDWQWATTGKTRLNAALGRDTGSEASFFTQTLAGESVRGSGDNSRVTTSLAMRVENEVTGKITLHAGGGYALRRLSASVQPGGGAPAVIESGEERSGNVYLGVRYAPTRNSVIACDVGYERRGTRTTLSSPYRANTATCSAQIALQ